MIDRNVSSECSDGARLCPVCGGECGTLDRVDLNKSCEESKGRALPRAGTLVEYLLCAGCGFCFAPVLCRWTIEEFSERIYNEHYEYVDPDYAVTRPSANAADLIHWFGASPPAIAHLDYGGGYGLLSDFLRDSGWNSASYDPFFDRSTPVADLARFDLITAYEVFEHVPERQQAWRRSRQTTQTGGNCDFQHRAFRRLYHGREAVDLVVRRAPERTYQSVFPPASDCLGQNSDSTSAPTRPDCTRSGERPRFGLRVGFLSPRSQRNQFGGRQLTI